MPPCCVKCRPIENSMSLHCSRGTCACLCPSLHVLWYISRKCQPYTQTPARILLQSAGHFWSRPLAFGRSIITAPPQQPYFFSSCLHRATLPLLQAVLSSEVVALWCAASSPIMCYLTASLGLYKLHHPISSITVPVVYFVPLENQLQYCRRDVNVF